MKKSESVKKTTKTKSTTPVRKSNSTPKSKIKENKKQQPSFFVLLGDNFYVADSKTERKKYQQFEEKAKISNIVKAPSRSKHFQREQVNLQQYVKSLSKAEKEQLMKDLSKQIEVEKEEIPEVVQQKQNKLERLYQKLQNIKGELMVRWQQKINQINHLFETQQISLEDKNKKVVLIQKIRSNKLTMIDYTRVLFQKILREQGDLQINKQQHIDQIINSLNSFNSMNSLSEHIKQIDPNLISHPYPSFPLDSPLQNQINSLKKPKEEWPHREQWPLHNEHDNFEQIEHDLQNAELGQCNNIKIEECQKIQEPVINRQSLKLDIRLDEVQFGKDDYDQQPIQVDKNKEKQSLNLKNNFFDIHFDKKQKQVQKQQPLRNKALQDQFLCADEQNDKIKIPLLLTKDRLQQIQLQKTSKQIQTLNSCIASKQQFQMSKFIPQDKNHFTTLMDVNQFIVSFGQFLLKNFMEQVLTGMNIPFGKSCIDKLYQIRNEGCVFDHDQTNVLPEQFLHRFHQEIALTVRPVPQNQKFHNLALFHTFNNGLNFYRSYYELQGEVFPWSITQKGFTFYQISDDNIEQVFRQSTMKMLQYCTCMCGLIPNCELTTVEANKVLNKMHEDTYERVLKNQIKQKFDQWNIKLVNFQAFERLRLCQQIFENQIILLWNDLNKIGKNRIN